MGLLLANYEVTGTTADRPRRLASIWAVAGALGLWLVLHRIHYESLEFTGVALVFGVVTWYLLSKHRPRLAFLESRLFYTVSRLSFGMYLNHLYLHKAVADFGLEWLPLADQWPACHHALTIGILVLLSAAGACVTYCLVEYPFLKLRGRLLDRGKEPAHPTALAVVPVAGLPAAA
jgi:peptidoglycan/LPS O-acetylase OafA/YrhL